MDDPTDVPLPPELAETDGVLSDEDLSSLAETSVAASDGRLTAAAYADLAERIDRWRITSDALAEWAMRKLAEARDHRAQVKGLADGWRAKIDAWERRADAPFAVTASFFTAHLEEYAIERREATGSATLRLPSGDVSTRLGPERVEVAKADEFVAWATENAPTLLRVRDPEVAKREVNDAVGIGDRIVCYELRITLRCGHVEVGLAPTPASAVGEDIEWPCSKCASVVRGVTSVDVEPVTERVPVLRETGEPVPGLVVVPPSITASIR